MDPSPYSVNNWRGDSATGGTPEAVRASRRIPDQETLRHLAAHDEGRASLLTRLRRRLRPGR